MKSAFCSAERLMTDNHGPHTVMSQRVIRAQLWARTTNDSSRFRRVAALTAMISPHPHLRPGAPWVGLPHGGAETQRPFCSLPRGALQL